MTAGRGTDEPIGSVGEEAAKLFAALSDLAKEHVHDSAGPAAGSAVGSVFRELNDHVATGGEDCRYCPVCRTISFVRETSPEVKSQLISGASSLLQAFNAMLLQQPAERTADPVQKIDLDSAEGWDD